MTRLLDDLAARVPLHRVASDLLGTEIAATGETRTKCIRPAAHRHGDEHPSLDVHGERGVYICRVCGESGDLVQLVVARGIAPDVGAAIGWLREKYDLAAGRNGHATNGRTVSLHAPSSVEPTSAREFPFYPDVAKDLGWPIVERNGLRWLAVPTWDADGRPARTKMRGPRVDGKLRCEFVGDGACGLVNAPAIRAASASHPLVILVNGETSLLAVEHSRRAERLEAAVVCASKGEAARLRDLARHFVKCRVVLIGDADPTGRANAPRRAEEIKAAGATSVRVVFPPRGKDARDFVESGGTLLELLEAPDARAAAATGRPRILVRQELSAVTDEAERALVADAGADLYVRAGMLVRVTRADPAKCKARAFTRPEGAHVIEPAPAAFVRERLDKAAEFVNGKTKRAALPPSFAVDTLLARGSWPLPTLAGLVESPTMRPDGSVLEEPGYDERTGLLHEPAVEFPGVPKSPTADDVRAAVATLSEPFADFPFVAQSDRAAAVAAVLTTVARHAIEGPAPLSAVRATSPGSGKSLLVDLVSSILTGRTAARMAIGRDDAETRKLILSIGLEGAPVVLLDNVEGALGSGVLAAALTSTTFADRLLGVNKRVTVSLRGTTWFATGNGLAFRGDLGRRVVPIDLDAGVEHPEDRRDFKHPELLAFVRAERARLVVAALTILRAFHVAGRPAHGAARVGSFEEWDDLVRGACVWAGFGDPVAGRRRIRDEGDADLDALRGALAAWFDAFGSTAVTAAVAIEKSTHSSELRAALASLADCSADKLDARKLGYALRRVCGRIADGRHFARASGETHGAVRWRVATTGGDEGDGGDVSSRPAASPYSEVTP